MDYIISPNIFYDWHIVAGMRDFLIMISIISGIAFLVSSITYLLATDDYFNKTRNLSRKISIFSIIILLTSSIITIFIPDKTTLIEMTLAKYITTDKINWTIDQIKELIDYIAMVFKG